MKCVQDALKDVGIPVYALTWRTTEEYPVPPAEYMVYTTMIKEDEHFDDGLVQYKLFIYLNLWGRNDITESVTKVRAAMRAAGFDLVEERDCNVDSRTAFNYDSDLYQQSWTWTRLEDAT